jgi:hypothetical protein
MAKCMDGRRKLDAVRAVMAEAGASEERIVAPFTVNGVEMLLRTLSPERLAALWEWRRSHRHDNVGLCARLIAASVVDAEGNERLTPAEALEMGDVIAEVVVAEVLKRNKIV